MSSIHLHCSYGVKHIIHHLPISKRRQVHAFSYIIFMRFHKLFRAFLSRLLIDALRLAVNTGRKKSPYRHHRTTLSSCIFATKACTDNRKKIVKQQYLLHMSSQYGELRPTNGWDLLASLRHLCKFQRVSRLGSVTARHLVVGVSQTLGRWTEGATYVRQGGHQVGHWPTF